MFLTMLLCFNNVIMLSYYLTHKHTHTPIYIYGDPVKILYRFTVVTNTCDILLYDMINIIF